MPIGEIIIFSFLTLHSKDVYLVQLLERKSVVRQVCYRSYCNKPNEATVLPGETLWKALVLQKPLFYPVTELPEIVFWNIVSPLETDQNSWSQRENFYG